MSRVECRGFFVCIFFLLKKKPTQEMTISSYAKSACVVHIAESLSFNSNANCQSIDTKPAHISLAVGRRKGRENQLTARKHLATCLCCQCLHE